MLTFGHPGNFAADAIKEVAREGLDPAHYDLRFAKPLDEALLAAPPPACSVGSSATGSAATSLCQGR